MHTASRTLLLLSAALLSTGVDAADVQQVSGKRSGDSGGCGEDIGFVNNLRYADDTADADVQTGVQNDASNDIQNVGYSAKCRTQGQANCGPVGRRGSGARQGDYCQPGDNCNLRRTKNDYALNWNGSCGPTGRLCAAGCPMAQKTRACCNTKAFPDSGWAPPAHVPMTRSGGGYSQYWPNEWYGNPGGSHFPAHPMVYQPTDTTQQGYSYANVPTWRPNPGMIPPVPYPSNFHHRYCPVDARYSSAGSYSTSNEVIIDGGYIDGGMIYGESCPSCETGEVQMGAVQRMQQEMAANLARNRGVRPASSETLTSDASISVAAARDDSGWRASARRSDDQAQVVSAQANLESTQQQLQSHVQQTANVRPQANVRRQANGWSQPQGRPQMNMPQQHQQQQRQQVRPAMVQNQPRSSSQQAAQRPSNRTAQQNESRRASQSKQKSGGWFGLPALSEMTF